MNYADDERKAVKKKFLPPPKQQPSMNLQSHVQLYPLKEFVDQYPTVIDCKLQLAPSQPVTAAATAASGSSAAAASAAVLAGPKAAQYVPCDGTAVKFNAIGDYVAVGCSEGSIRIIDMATKQVIRELATGGFIAIPKTPSKGSSKKSAASSNDASQSLESKHAGAGSAATSASAADGSSSADGSEWRSFAPESTPGRHTNFVHSVSWYRNNRKIVSAGADGRVILWDVLKEAPEKSYFFDARQLYAEVNPVNHSLILVMLRGQKPCIINTDTDEIMRADLPLGIAASHAAALASAAIKELGDEEIGPAPNSSSKSKQKEECLACKWFADGTKFVATIAMGYISIFGLKQQLGSSPLSSAASQRPNYVRLYTIAPPHKGAAPILGIQLSTRGHYMLMNAERSLRLYDTRGPVITLVSEYKDLILQTQFSYSCFSGDNVTDDRNWDSEYVVGCNANKIYIWERQYPDNLIKILEGPAEGILSTEWHPFRPILCSTTVGGIVNFWMKPLSESWGAFQPGFDEVEVNDVYFETENEFDASHREEEDSKIASKQMQREEDPGFVDVLTIEKSSWDLKGADDAVHLTNSPIPDRDIKREELMQYLLQQVDSKAQSKKGKRGGARPRAKAEEAASAAAAPETTTKKSSSSSRGSKKAASASTAAAPATAKPAPKKRGRKRKYPLPEESQTESDAATAGDEPLPSDAESEASSAKRRNIEAIDSETSNTMEE